MTFSSRKKTPVKINKHIQLNVTQPAELLAKLSQNERLENMTRAYTVAEFMEDMLKIKSISRINGLDFPELIRSMIKFGEQNNAKAPGFQIFKRLALQPDFLNKQDVYNYNSNDLQARVKNSPLKFHMFHGIPNQQSLISSTILKTDFKTVTQIYELNLTIKKLPQFMLRQFEIEIQKRLQLQDVNVLNIEVHKKAEDLFQILIHVINKNVAKSDEKRKQSRIQTQKYLQSLAKETGEGVSKSLQYADVITNVSDPKIYSQVGGTCYAHAVAQAIYSTQARIKGRVLENHEKLAQRIIDKHGDKGGYPQVCLDQQCPPKRIRWGKVDPKKACEAVLMGRVVILQFCLSKKGWDDFSSFQSQGKSMKNLQKMKDSKQQGSGGHAVAIVGVDTKQKTWIVKNAWGLHEINSIKFRNSIVKMKMDIKHFEYLDVYFWQSDLNQYQILSYQKYLKTKTKDERELEERREQLMRSTSSKLSRRLTQDDQIFVLMEDISEFPKIPVIERRRNPLWFLRRS